MRSLNRHRVWVVAILLIALMPITLFGCFGSFPVTHAIYGLNQDVSDNKLVRTIVFWVFVIIPVYEIGIFVDVVAFNLIEFWTGEKVLSSGPMEDAFGNIVTLEPSEDGNELLMTMTRDGVVIAQDRYVKIDDSLFEIRDATDNLKGLVIVTPEGDIQLAQTDGKVIKTIKAGSHTPM